MNAAITVVILGLSWVLHTYAFWLALTLAVVYWVLEARFKYPNPDLEDWYVEPRPEGLLMSAPGPDGGPPIRLTTPWEQLRLIRIVRKADRVASIKLADKDLPNGVRMHNLQNYENMDDLLAEIERRIGS